jgi:transcriptional regulator with XRE-family HTH domain
MRRLRKDSAKSAEEVAKALGWSESKVLYIESGQGVRPNPRDVEDLCDRVYSVTGKERRELLQLAKDGRLKGWWHSFSTMLSRVYTTYIGLEAEAAAIRTFQPLMIPGLAQTEDYARALIRGSTKLDDKAIEQRVKVRAERQKILEASDPADLWIVLDEAAIRRVVGGPHVMRQQLEHLIELSEFPHVTLQVVPFGGGAHPGINGPFTILRFPHAADAPAVYIEAISGQLFVEGDEVGEYEQAFERLIAAALSIPDTIALMAAAAADLR